MDPHLISLILSYGIDDVDDSVISSLSDSQKRYLLFLLDDKEERLHNALINGHLEKMKLFLPFKKYHEGWYERIAIIQGHCHIVKYLFDKSIYQLGRSDFDLFIRGNSQLGTVIFQKGNIEMAELLISYGAELDRKYSSYDPTVERLSPLLGTPLQLSILTQNLPMMRMLIEKGASVSYDDYCAVDIAIKCKNMEAFKELIEYVPESILASKYLDSTVEKVANIVLDKIIGNNDLMEEVITTQLVHNDIEMIQLILKKGYIPSEKYLTYAVRNGLGYCANLLWKHGVSTDGLSFYEVTKLHIYSFLVGK